MKKWKNQKDKKAYQEYQNRQYFISGMVEALIAQYDIDLALRIVDKIARQIEIRKERRRVHRTENIRIKYLLVTQFKLKMKNIPQDLVEVKKLQLTIRKLLEEKTNGKKNHHNVKK
jgi:hypothetical protein